jgi:hypothetical protein
VYILKLGVVVHAWNSSSWEVEDVEFEASLNYLARPYLKKQQKLTCGSHL